VNGAETEADGSGGAGLRAAKRCALILVEKALAHCPSILLARVDPDVDLRREPKGSGPGKAETGADAVPGASRILSRPCRDACPIVPDSA
jgi:hypothetical protein